MKRLAVLIALLSASIVLAQGFYRNAELVQYTGKKTYYTNITQRAWVISSLQCYFNDSLTATLTVSRARGAVVYPLTSYTLSSATSLFLDRAELDGVWLAPNDKLEFSFNWKADVTNSAIICTEESR